MGYEVSPKSQPTSVVAKNKTQTESKNNGNGKDSLAVMSKRLGAFTIQEDVKEGEPEDEEGLTLYPYHRLITASTDPAPEIDATKREVQISLSLSLFPSSFPLFPSSFHLDLYWYITFLLLVPYRHTSLQLSSERSLGWQRRLLQNYQNGSKTG